MFDELQKAEARFEELEGLLGTSRCYRWGQQLHVPERTRLLEPLAELFRAYKSAKQELADNEELSKDASDSEMAVRRF